METKGKKLITVKISDALHKALTDYGIDQTATCRRALLAAVIRQLGKETLAGKHPMPKPKPPEKKYCYRCCTQHVSPIGRRCKEIKKYDRW